MKGDRFSYMHQPFADIIIEAEYSLCRRGRGGGGLYPNIDFSHHLFHITGIIWISLLPLFCIFQQIFQKMAQKTEICKVENNIKQKNKQKKKQEKEATLRHVRNPPNQFFFVCLSVCLRCYHRHRRKKSLRLFSVSDSLPPPQLFLSFSFFCIFTQEVRIYFSVQSIFDF